MLQAWLKKLVSSKLKRKWTKRWESWWIKTAAEFKLQKMLLHPRLNKPQRSLPSDQPSKRRRQRKKLRKVQTWKLFRKIRRQKMRCRWLIRYQQGNKSKDNEIWCSKISKNKRVNNRNISCLNFKIESTNWKKRRLRKRIMVPICIE